MRRVLEARFAAIRLRGDIPICARRRASSSSCGTTRCARWSSPVENWARQRGPADARILLEAALAAGAPEAARPVLEWLQATRIEDVALSRLAEQLASAGS